MLCNICKLSSPEVLSKVEAFLLANDGILTEANRRELIEQYPMYKDEINKINAQDCEMHWNFHQTAIRTPVVEVLDLDSNSANEASACGAHVLSIAQDIKKDEATVLSEMLNKQAATFNLLTTKINNAIKNADDENIGGIVVHPVTLEMYKEIAGSIRLTIRELRDLNEAINGPKNDSFEGLKALASALAPNVNITAVNDAPGEMRAAEPSELTTDKFDY